MVAALQCKLVEVHSFVFFKKNSSLYFLKQLYYYNVALQPSGCKFLDILFGFNIFLFKILIFLFIFFRITIASRNP